MNNEKYPTLEELKKEAAEFYFSDYLLFWRALPMDIAIRTWQELLRETDPALETSFRECFELILYELNGAHFIEDKGISFCAYLEQLIPDDIEIETKLKFYKFIIQFSNFMEFISHYLPFKPIDREKELRFEKVEFCRNVSISENFINWINYLKETDKKYYEDHEECLEFIVKNFNYVDDLGNPCGMISFNHNEISVFRILRQIAFKPFKLGTRLECIMILIDFLEYFDFICWNIPLKNENEESLP